MNPVGQVLDFFSPVDGSQHPCAVSVTDDSPGPKALLIEVSPGAISDLPAAAALTQEIATIAAARGRSCVVLRPTGRGPGSVYQGYGEVDVLEAIEFAASRYEIDRDRISITGASMGGAATWYLVSHYPDLFAAAAPFCGYADYRLWEKPGGLTFHMRDWEEASWRARSAALLIENLGTTPIWMVHGEWDRAVGGGVSVEHSRQMARLLAARGGDIRYTELPATGHDSRRPDLWADVICWLLDQRRGRDPDQASLATGTLRHNRTDWLRIDQLEQYGLRGSVDATFAPAGRLEVTTTNIRALSLGPSSRGTIALVIDGTALGPVDLTTRRTFRQVGRGVWQPGQDLPSGEKRHGASGPIGDLFFEGTILVPGTTGSPEATFFNDWVARDAAQFYRARNGGVHRGGIGGVNSVDLPVISDVHLTDSDRIDRNLILYGTGTSNAVLARYAGALPVSFGTGSLRLADRAWEHPAVAAFAIFPHPENPDRYVAIHGGPAPDAVTWGSHLDMALLPDYLVYAGGETLEWGFWGNDWRSQQKP